MLTFVFFSILVSVEATRTDTESKSALASSPVWSCQQRLFKTITSYEINEFTMFVGSKYISNVSISQQITLIKSLASQKRNKNTIQEKITKRIQIIFTPSSITCRSETLSTIVGMIYCILYSNKPTCLTTSFLKSASANSLSLDLTPSM